MDEISKEIKTNKTHENLITDKKSIVLLWIDDVARGGPTNCSRVGGGVLGRNSSRGVLGSKSVGIFI